MNNLQNTIKSLMKSRRFDEALSRMDEIGPESWTPTLWVLRGKCIQLAEDTSLPLDEAKKSFQRALELDANCLEAWIELGYYVLCVEDDAQEASTIFQNAQRIMAEYEKEIQKGLLQCEEERTERGANPDSAEASEQIWKHVKESY